MDLMHYVGPKAIWFRTRACGQFKLVLKVCGQLIVYIAPMTKLLLTASGNYSLRGSYIQFVT
jgi:hypothetical protein